MRLRSRHRIRYAGTESAAGGAGNRGRRAESAGRGAEEEKQRIGRLKPADREIDDAVAVDVADLEAQQLERHAGAREREVRRRLWDHELRRAERPAREHVHGAWTSRIRTDQERVAGRRV